MRSVSTDSSKPPWTGDFHLTPTSTSASSTSVLGPRTPIDLPARSYGGASAPCAAAGRSPIPRSEAVLRSPTKHGPPLNSATLQCHQSVSDAGPTARSARSAERSSSPLSALRRRHTRRLIVVCAGLNLTFTAGGLRHPAYKGNRLNILLRHTARLAIDPNRDMTRSSAHRALLRSRRLEDDAAHFPVGSGRRAGVLVGVRDAGLRVRPSVLRQHRRRRPW